MSTFHQSLGGTTYQFDGIVDLLAKATPLRSGDELSGCAAGSDAERAAAQWALADVPMDTFLDEQVVPYDTDEVTRLIIDSHDAAAFGAISHPHRRRVPRLAAGRRDPARRRSDPHRAGPGLTPEMVAAVSKIMRNQDLIAVARGASVDHRVPHHDRVARPAEHPAAAQPPHRRSARHRRRDPGRAAARLR